jgi:hypothetical protein
VSILAARALDESSAEILAITAANGYRVRRVTRAGRTFRHRTVDFEDVPGETLIQAVPAAQDIVLLVDCRGFDAAGAADLEQVLVDELGNPALRTWYLELTFDGGRVETWRALRPADVTPDETTPLELNAAKVPVRVTCRVAPHPTVSEGSS